MAGTRPCLEDVSAGDKGMHETVMRKGLAETEVRSSKTGELLGRVADILINPDEGRIVGLVVDKGDGWVIRDFEYINGMFRASGEDRAQPGFYINDAKSVSVVEEIIGARVVTTGGTLLGRVSEAGVSDEGSLAIFRISKSFLHRLFRRGMLIRSDAPKSILKDGTGRGSRLIVPSEIPPASQKVGFVKKIDAESAGYGVLTGALILVLIGTLLAN